MTRKAMGSLVTTMFTCDTCEASTDIQWPDYRPPMPAGWLWDHKQGDLCPECRAAYESFLAARQARTDPPADATTGEGV